MKRLIRSLKFFRTLVMVAALVSVGMPVLYARADKADLIAVGLGNKLARDHLVSVTLGKGEVVTINGEVSDVLVANPAIADVVALQSNKLYIVGSQLGDTNLMALDAEGNVLQRLDIHVKIDEMAIQEYLKEIYPNEDVTVKALTDQVILTGTVSNPGIASRITQVVGAYIGEVQELDRTADEIIVNLLNVSGEQQVMLKVKIMEVSKNMIKELGIESLLELSSDPLAMLGVATGGAGTGLTDNAFGTGAVVIDSNVFGNLGVQLDALEEENLVVTLAEPNLTAISGQEAGFLAGGEFPVPAGRDNDGNLVIEFRSFGVSLNFRPTVLSESRISLQLNTEVSSLAEEDTVSIGGVGVPGLNIRRASTTVEVPSGGGLMIGGLLQSKTAKTMAGLPGIKDTPVLGDLISSRSFNRDESELLVLVTAYLVSPYAEKAAQAPLPQDVPDAPEHSPLSTAFADNIRRIYGRKAPDLLNEGGRFGYLIN